METVNSRAGAGKTALPMRESIAQTRTGENEKKGRFLDALVRAVADDWESFWFTYHRIAEGDADRTYPVGPWMLDHYCYDDAGARFVGNNPPEQPRRLDFSPHRARAAR